MGGEGGVGGGAGGVGGGAGGEGGEGGGGGDDDVIPFDPGPEIPLDTATWRAGFVDLFRMAGPGGETDIGCRDLDGDGDLDNTLAVLSPLVNRALGEAIEDVEWVMIILEYDIDSGFEQGRFDMGKADGNRRDGIYRLESETIDAQNRPLVRLEQVAVRDGVMYGDADALRFVVPINENTLDLNLTQARLRGVITPEPDPRGQPRGLTVQEGWLTGVLSQEALADALGFLPEDALPGIEALIPQPDVDSDGDGRPDAYGMCIRFDAVPIVLENYPPADAPE